MNTVPFCINLATYADPTKSNRSYDMNEEVSHIALALLFYRYASKSRNIQYVSISVKELYFPVHFPFSLFLSRGHATLELTVLVGRWVDRLSALWDLLDYCLEWIYVHFLQPEWTWYSYPCHWKSLFICEAEMVTSEEQKQKNKEKFRTHKKEILDYWDKVKKTPKGRDKSKFSLRGWSLSCKIRLKVGWVDRPR